MIISRIKKTFVRPIFAEFCNMFVDYFGSSEKFCS